MAPVTRTTIASIRPGEIELAILRKDLAAVHLHLSGDRLVEVSLREWPQFLLAQERMKGTLN